MAGPWTAERFPQFEAPIRRLTEQHRELVDEPLHLAVSYLPAMRDQQHIFLFPSHRWSRGKYQFRARAFPEAVFETTPGFPMGPDEQLHLILTNPRELETAFRKPAPRKRSGQCHPAPGITEVVQGTKSESGLGELEAEARRYEATRGLSRQPFYTRQAGRPAGRERLVADELCNSFGR